MILFRCNVGAGVGIGHLVRCRTLAAELRSRGEACAMAGPGEQYRTPADAALFDRWTPLEWTTSDADADAFIDLAADLGARVAVMDDYRIDEPYQLRLRDGGISWLQQFDASRPPPFWGDFVANGGPSERAEDYVAQNRNPDTAFLLGPEYAVLRPAFRSPETRPPDRPVERILLAFGGGDDHGLAIAALQVLLPATPPQVTFRVMSGASNPGAPAIADWIAAEGAGRAELAIDPADVAAQFRDADLAVLAGGTSTFEAAAMGLPMLIVALADNQIRQGQGWQGRGAGVFLGRRGLVNFNDMAQQVVSLIADRDRRVAMSAAGRDSVDGQGGRRLADRLLGVIR